jgi:hypothetical protein
MDLQVGPGCRLCLRNEDYRLFSITTREYLLVDDFGALVHLNVGMTMATLTEETEKDASGR